MLDSLPIILKIVVLHGLLVARTMAKGKTAKARIAKGMNVSVKDVFSKVFLDRFPESANHKQQGRAHFQEDGAMTQTSIIKAWKKLSLPWIARHLQLYHRFSWSCISVWLFVFGFWMHIYIYICLL